MSESWPSPALPEETVEAPISLLLTEIEGRARAIYARHGLPDRPGHYARKPKSRTWRFLAENLTAEERWALVTAQRPGALWRFGTLEDIGDQVDSPPDLRGAARMLRTCRRLRTRLADSRTPDLAEDFEAAIRLGAEWRRDELGVAPVPKRSQSLKPIPASKSRAKRKS